MPDILTHLFATHILVRTPIVFKNKFLQFYLDYKVAIYFGAILPDLFAKPFQFISSALYNFGLALHSPFCVFILCCLVSLFFYIKDQKKSFIALTFFAMLHILIDNLQKGINPGYQTFFPFSLKRYGFNLLSSEMYLYLLGVSVFLVIGIELYIYFRSKIERDETDF